MNHPQIFRRNSGPNIEITDAIDNNDCRRIIDSLNKIPIPTMKYELERILLYIIDHRDDITTDTISKNIMMFDTLIKEFNFDMSQIQNLWKYAVCHDVIPIIKYLLDNGIDINMSDGYAICTVCFLNLKSELLTLLIDHQADVQINNNYPLKRAIWQNNLQHIQILIDAGAYIQSLSDYEVNTLARQWNHHTVKLLLDHQINIRGKNDYALMYSTSCCRYKITQLLLDANADIHANNEGALINAIHYSDLRMIKLLLDNGANGKNLSINNPEITTHVTKIIELLEPAGINLEQIITIMHMSDKSDRH